MVQVANSRRKWTLDDWNAAFDWGNRTSKDAEAFLADEGISLSVDLTDIPVEAFRCVGFAYLYEAGRIFGANEGGAGWERLENQDFLDRLKNIDLNGRAAATETDSMQIFVKRDLTVKELKVLATDPVWLVKILIHQETGISLLKVLLSIVLEVDADRSGKAREASRLAMHHPMWSVVQRAEVLVVL
jgi:hypothetical protein